MTSWAVEASQMRAQDLESGVMTWVAKQQSLPSDQVQVIPIDQRVKLKNCEKEIK